MTAQIINPDSNEQRLKSDDITTKKEQSHTDIIIVGNGPVGIQLVKELRRNQYQGSIRVFGDEPGTPYDRVRLSSYLFGSVTPDELENVLEESQVFENRRTRIELIDPVKKLVTDDQGNEYSYDKLVLATGSRAHVPNLKGVSQKGVYCFRSKTDAEWLLARKTRSTNTVVVGAGLLGMEAAAAMNRHGNKVTLVQHSTHILNHQLDEQAAALVEKHNQRKGIHILCSTRVLEIGGRDKVEYVSLSNGTQVPCDTLILATGIRPNIELALEAGLPVGNGIKIDDALETKDPDVYAIGECAEHNSKVYGLVGPGMEQASILAARLTGKTPEYKGSLQASRLKVTDFDVFSAGVINDELLERGSKSMTFSSEGIYRRIFLQNYKVVGFVSVGPYKESHRVQEILNRQGSIYPWQLRRFQKTGLLWPESETDSPAAWPETMVICNCRNVTAGRINSFCESQNDSLINVVDIQKETGAGTVCGSCKPLLQQFESTPNQQKTDSGLSHLKSFLAIGSLTAFALAIVYLAMPELNAVTSASSLQISDLWSKSIPRQITGFTVLGLTAIAMVLTFRKRIEKFKFLTFGFWRGLHIALFIIAIFLISVHTGLNMGQGLNRLLISNFLLLMATGAVLGTLSALAKSGKIKFLSQRRNWNWIHLVVAWPLPVLLAFHILSVYYF